MPGPLSDIDDIRRYSNALRLMSERRIEALTRDLADGKMTLAEWQERMKAELRRANLEQFVVGKGGVRANINRREYLQLGPELKRQYRYLDRFAALVQDRAEAGQPITFAIERAKLYARSTQASMWRSAVPVRLPQVPRDGKTRCRTNCKCRLDFAYERGDEGQVTAVLVTWRLRPAEHCFPAGTLVLTPRGEVPIEEIRLGDEVTTRHGARKVTRLYRRGFSGSLVRVRAGRRQALCTPNHPFLTRRGWVEAQDLVSGQDAVLLENDFQQVFTEIGLPNANHRVPAGGEISILSFISGTLLKLPLAQRFKARMAVPPIAVGLDDQVANSNVNDELRLDQKVRLIFDSQIVERCKKTKLQLRRFVSLEPPMAFKQRLNDVRATQGLLSQSLGRARLMRGVVLSHVFGGLRVDKPVRRLFAQGQLKPVSFVLHLLSRAINMARNFIRPHLGVVGAQKRDLILAPVSLFRVMLGAIGRLPLTPVLATDGALLAKHVFPLSRIIHVPAVNRAKPPARVVEGFSADFARLHRLNPPQVLYPKQGEIQVFNLEVEGEHEYIANGFVVHNCEDCIRLSRDWNPRRFPIREAGSLEQGVGLLLMEADDLTAEEAHAICDMWDIEEQKLWTLH